MSEQTGEKTEQATPKRLEEAWKKGQFARSAEVQTVFVLVGALMALMFTGRESWDLLAQSMLAIFGHLHEISVTHEAMHRQFIEGITLISRCVLPVLAATVVAGLLAGGTQSHFRTAPEALAMRWERLDPIEGAKRLFSMRSAVPTGIAILKLTVIIALSWSVIKTILDDPIFYSAVDVARIAGFLADASFKIIVRVIFALAVLAALDYGYQLWRTSQDMMMTRDEVKEEVKNQEGNSQVKTQRQRRRRAISQRKMLSEVPAADVVVTNPTHLAVALRYDRKSMRAPRIIAKGSRLNALRIREIARQHQVPIVENKPLARLMFKHGRVGGEIPAELYAAVAEILAYVYRINAYRYYREQNQL